MPIEVDFKILMTIELDFEYWCQLKLIDLKYWCQLKLILNTDANWSWFLNIDANWSWLIWNIDANWS